MNNFQIKKASLKKGELFYLKKYYFKVKLVSNKYI